MPQPLFARITSLGKEKKKKQTTTQLKETVWPWAFC